MKDECATLILYRIDRAKETLDDAEILYKQGKFNSAVNRLYYSMFYAVNALLFTKGFSSSKHSGVRSLFDREFVNKGIVSKFHGEFYRNIFENRQEGDYKDFVKFRETDVEEWIKKAKEFVIVVENIINKSLKEIDTEKK